jgi:hypothetical protein
MGFDHLEAVHHLQRQRGIQHVRAGHAEVNIAPGIAHVLIDASQKRDHIVPHFRFNF